METCLNLLAISGTYWGESTNIFPLPSLILSLEMSGLLASKSRRDSDSSKLQDILFIHNDETINWRIEGIYCTDG